MFYRKIKNYLDLENSKTLASHTHTHTDIYIIGLLNNLINSDIDKIIIIVSYLYLKKQHMSGTLELYCIFYFLFRILDHFNDQST